MEKLALGYFSSIKKLSNAFYKTHLSLKIRSVKGLQNSLISEGSYGAIRAP